VGTWVTARLSPETTATSDSNIWLVA